MDLLDAVCHTGRCQQKYCRVHSKPVALKLAERASGGAAAGSASLIYSKISSDPIPIAWNNGRYLVPGLVRLPPLVDASPTRYESCMQHYVGDCQAQPHNHLVLDESVVQYQRRQAGRIAASPTLGLLLD